MTIALHHLRDIAATIRARIVRNAHATHTPHIGSCLSCVDLLVAAYFHGLRITPESPHDPKRDRFILSKGHAAPALFQTLSLRGYFAENTMHDYGQDGSLFAEHPPTPDQLPGIEAATGALGHGLPIALGEALAARILQQDYRVVALLGDGECNEGTIWEAALLAAAQKVPNLMVFIDYNKWQATGRSDQVMALPSLVEKWRAFGWHTLEIDGHDMEQITNVWQQLSSDQPTAIIAHTIKGKGVSFMEDDNNWHYRIPSDEMLVQALAELEM